MCHRHRKVKPRNSSQVKAQIASKQKWYLDKCGEMKACAQKGGNFACVCAGEKSGGREGLEDPEETFCFVLLWAKTHTKCVF